MNLYVIAGIVAVVVAGLWMFGRRMRQGGESKVIAKVATETAKTQQKQAQAAADAPEGKEDVLKRIREKGL